MKSSNTTLVSALRILARDIVSEDGVANACIAEAADRIVELESVIESQKRMIDRLNGAD